MNLINILAGGLVSWKTTLTGVIGALILLLNTMGVVHITPEQQSTVVAFAVLVVGFLAKDSNKIGSPTDG